MKSKKKIFENEIYFFGTTANSLLTRNLCFTIGKTKIRQVTITENYAERNM